MPPSNHDHQRDDAFDLEAYLARIGRTGPQRADHATLAAMLHAHALAIPYENLDPWCGRQVALDLGSLQRKLVARPGRGGYCYEHNLLLGAALRALGFAVTDLAARVSWGVAPEVVRPRTHMLMRVDLDGERFVVDAGFGGRTLTAPLRLDDRAPQATPHGRVRIALDEGGLFRVDADVAGEWRSLYSFDLQPQRLPDYEMTSWYLCANPASLFRQVLVAVRPLAEGRWTLRDRVLNFHAPDGRVDTTLLTSASALREALADRFGIDVAGIDGLDAKLAELATRPD
jgi:N-hydroxyarylamine O-acetyltransferase